jgi:type I restriction enzyme S subunit
MGAEPTEWITRKIGDFAARSKIINEDGTQLPPLSITKDRGVVLQSEKYKKQIATDLRKYVIARRDQFAFDPMSLYYGAIGRVARMDVGLVSPDYVVFDVDDTVDKTFLNYLLRSPPQVATYEAVAETGNSFGKRRRVYWSVLEQLAVRLPPLAEQRKIAAILAAVDAAIEATQAVIAQLQVVKSAMMAELLMRGLPGRHTRFKQTKIGTIPDDWTAPPLGECLEGIDAGWSPKCDARSAAPEEWGVLKVSAVSWGEFRAGENKHLPIDLDPRPELEVQERDVLVSRANTPELVGRAVLVRTTRPRLMLSDKLLRLRPRTALLDASYLNLVLGTPTSRLQIEDRATGSSRSMKNISQEALRSIAIPVPPLDEQRAIASAVDSVAARIAEEASFTTALATLKAALMSALLTGEIRVTTDEVAA